MHETFLNTTSSASFAAFAEDTASFQVTHWLIRDESDDVIIMLLSQASEAQDRVLSPVDLFNL